MNAFVVIKVGSYIVFLLQEMFGAPFVQISVGL